MFLNSTEIPVSHLSSCYIQSCITAAAAAQTAFNQTGASATHCDSISTSWVLVRHTTMKLCRHFCITSLTHLLTNNTARLKTGQGSSAWRKAQTQAANILTTHKQKSPTFGAKTASKNRTSSTRFSPPPPTLTTTEHQHCTDLTAPVCCCQLPTTPISSSLKNRHQTPHIQDGGERHNIACFEQTVQGSRQQQNPAKTAARPSKENQHKAVLCCGCCPY